MSSTAEDNWYHLKSWVELTTQDLVWFSAIQEYRQQEIRRRSSARDHLLFALINQSLGEGVTNTLSKGFQQCTQQSAVLASRLWSLIQSSEDRSDRLEELIRSEAHDLKLLIKASDKATQVWMSSPLA